jgi:hypothetical protein
VNFLFMPKVGLNPLTSPMPDPALGRLFSPVVMRVIAITNDGAQ